MGDRVHNKVASDLNSEAAKNMATDLAYSVPASAAGLGAGLFAQKAVEMKSPIAAGRHVAGALANKVKGLVNRTGPKTPVGKAALAALPFIGYEGGGHIGSFMGRKHHIAGLEANMTKAANASFKNALSNKLDDLQNNHELESGSWNSMGQDDWHKRLDHISSVSRKTSSDYVANNKVHNLKGTGNKAALAGLAIGGAGGLAGAAKLLAGSRHVAAPSAVVAAGMGGLLAGGAIGKKIDAMRAAKHRPAFDAHVSEVANKVWDKDLYKSASILGAATKALAGSGNALKSLSKQTNVSKLGAKGIPKSPSTITPWKSPF